jgi:hypothetical protein
VRDMIGCAGMIAAIAFLLGLIGSLFVNEVNLFQRLMIALMPAALGFVAALLLLTRDRLRHTATMRDVRRMLLARRDVNDDEFIAQFPAADATFLAQIRQALSQFFDVPAEKIYATDNLNKDLRFSTFEPAIHCYVVYHILNAHDMAHQAFKFNTADLSDIADLAQEIQRVLDRCKNANRRANF